MKKPHKYAELIKAWADGAEIEYLNTTDDKWKPIFKGWSWDATFDIDMRIKPEPKPDVVTFGFIPDWIHLQSQSSATWWFDLAVKHACRSHQINLSLTFDGETGKLKSAEVI